MTALGSCVSSCALGTAALLACWPVPANAETKPGLSEQATQFVAAAYLQPLGLENVPIDIVIAGHANPFTARTLAVDVRPDDDCGDQETPAAVRVFFFVRDRELVGLAADGQTLDKPNVVPEAARRERRAAGIAAVRLLFGWDEVEWSTVVPESQNERVVFKTREQGGRTIDRSADFDPTTGFLRRAGRLL